MKKKYISVSESLNRKRIRAEKRIEKLKPLIAEAHKLLKNTKVER